MTRRLPALAAAELNGDPRYTGKVCSRHPEEAGRRYTNTRYCVACARESVRRSTQRKKEAQQHDNGR